MLPVFHGDDNVACVCFLFFQSGDNVTCLCYLCFRVMIVLSMLPVFQGDL